MASLSSLRAQRPGPAQRLAALLQASRWWQAALLLLLVVVSWLALSPVPPKSVDLGWDKLNHLSAFSALAFCAWLGQGAAPRRRLLALLGLLAYGGLIELLQAQVPGRSAEWADLLADAGGLAIGSALSAMLLRLVLRWLSQRTTQSTCQRS